MQQRDWGDTRAAFEQAAIWFAEVVPDDTYAWDRPGLGDWTVRDLVGHTSRALITTEQYLGAATADDAVEIESPAEYYRIALAAHGDPAAVAERGRIAGAALGPHPSFAIAKLVAHTVSLVESTSPDALVGTPVGGMRLIDYLPTRTFELVVHGCDIAEVIGHAVDVPDAAAADSTRLLGELAVTNGAAGRLLLAATGRGALPDGFTVL